MISYTSFLTFTLDHNNNVHIGDFQTIESIPGYAKHAFYCRWYGDLYVTSMNTMQVDSEAASYILSRWPTREAFLKENNKSTTRADGDRYEYLDGYLFYLGCDTSTYDPPEVVGAIVGDSFIEWKDYENRLEDITKLNLKMFDAGAPSSVLKSIVDWRASVKEEWVVLQCRGIEIWENSR